MSRVQFRPQLSAIGAALLLLIGGCQSSQSKPANNAPPSVLRGVEGDRPKPHYIDVERIPARNDIVSIHCFWPQVPWLSDSSGKPVGFRVPVYFVSGQTEKGAFVTGNVLAWVYEMVPGDDGGLARKLLYMWEYDETQAENYRVRKEAVAGYYYGFMLSWPLDLDLSGKLVEIEFGYERKDGRVILSTAKRLRAPVSHDRVIRSTPPASQPATPPVSP